MSGGVAVAAEQATSETAPLTGGVVQAAKASALMAMLGKLKENASTSFKVRAASRPEIWQSEAARAARRSGAAARRPTPRARTAGGQALGGAA